MKDAVKREYELLQTLITHTEDYIYIKDSASRFLMSNLATAKLMGVQHPDELFHKTDFDFYPYELASRYYADEQEIVRTGRKKINYEEPLVDHEGTLLHIVTTKIPVKDASGQVVGLIGIGRDITARKQAEEVLKRDKDTLERLAQERAEKVVAVQLQLEQAKRLSEIGTLAATVAHELRNPLAAISMVVANISRKVKLPELDGYLDMIERKVAESHHIINNLLFYSRIKAPVMEDVALQRMVHECVEVLQAREAKRVAVINRLESLPAITVRADAVQLTEVLNNVLNNAYDALPAEGGAIEVDAEEDIDWTRIYVKDNGGGISQRDLEKAFEPFYTTKSHGTGLGLAVCRHIIHLHAGTIRLESSPGRGTRVLIKLPKRSLAL